MKILIGCLNINGYGGSEFYHYELARELHSQGEEVTLFSLREINPQGEIYTKLTSLGVTVKDRFTFNPLRLFDIVVVSQPEPTQVLLPLFKNTPFISIIHSEIRSEDPVLDPRISHYIAIRQSIADMLIRDYKIEESKVSLIYNPIDQSRFNRDGITFPEKLTGLFVGEVMDPIRAQAVDHLVKHCIAVDIDLLLMSDTRRDFRHPNIKYISKRWDTENVVKHVTFTAGILLGRTTLESWCCEKPSYIYNIDTRGNILGVDTSVPPTIVRLCNSSFVAKEHLKLYNSLI